MVIVEEEILQCVLINMINLFIDSNIWLDLYHYSSDDLDEFSKLSDMRNVDINILLTEQIKNEVFRNRDNKIYDAYKKFKIIGIQFPNLCKGYDEYKKLYHLNKEFIKLHKELCKKIEIDISKQKLHADIVINNFFSDSNIIPLEENIIQKAKNRFDIGNPPGKDKSYGDMINWLLLLEKVPKKEDLFFISSDSDFSSPIDNKLFNTYLLNEWKLLKESNLFFYSSLSSFFKEHIKDIQLKSENEKTTLIAKLFNSPHFAS